MTGNFGKLINFAKTMKEKLPINKDVLIWARTSMGLSVEEVAYKFSKHVQDIEVQKKKAGRLLLGKTWNQMPRFKKSS